MRTGWNWRVRWPETHGFLGLRVSSIGIIYTCSFVSYRFYTFGNDFTIPFHGSMKSTIFPSLTMGPESPVVTKPPTGKTDNRLVLRIWKGWCNSWLHTKIYNHSDPHDIQSKTSTSRPLHANRRYVSLYTYVPIIACARIHNLRHIIYGHSRLRSTLRSQ